MGVERSETDDALVYELRVEATPEVVFAQFTDPVRLTGWIGRSAILDPRPGGVFRIEFANGDVALGRFEEVEPSRRLAFTWGGRTRTRRCRPARPPSK